MQMVPWMGIQLTKMPVELKVWCGKEEEVQMRIELVVI